MIKIIYAIAVIGWLIALGLWLYAIINKTTRIRGVYLYYLIALLFFNLVIQIVTLIS